MKQEAQLLDPQVCAAQVLATFLCIGGLDRRLEHIERGGLDAVADGEFMALGEFFRPPAQAKPETDSGSRSPRRCVWNCPSSARGAQKNATRVSPWTEGVLDQIGGKSRQDGEDRGRDRVHSAFLFCKEGTVATACKTRVKKALYQHSPDAPGANRGIGRLGSLPSPMYAIGSTAASGPRSKHALGDSPLAKDFWRSHHLLRFRINQRVEWVERLTKGTASLPPIRPPIFAVRSNRPRSPYP